MKRASVVAGLVTLVAVAYALRARCWLRGRGHKAVRHPLGGFKCADCGKTGADLADMGDPSGYVESVVRRVYDRDRQEFTRTDAWGPGRRGW